MLGNWLGFVAAQWCDITVMLIAVDMYLILNTSSDTVNSYYYAEGQCVVFKKLGQVKAPDCDPG